VRRLLTAGAVLALALPAAAAAHVTVLPTFLEAGKRTTLEFSAPNERAPHGVTRLTVTAPDGIELSAAEATPGWKLTTSGSTAVWSGGRTPHHTVGVFRVAAETSNEPAGVTLRAVQRYDDGASVPWTIPFTILPVANPPKEHLLPALLAGIVGFVVILGSLAFLRLRPRATRR